jgi:hypothetical protein
MKSPREALLDRHRDQTPALDAIRRQVLEQELAPARHVERQPKCRSAVAWWRILISGPRAGWTALAAAWCVIIGLNLAARQEQVPVAKSPTADRERMLAGLREYHARLAVLLADPTEAVPDEAGTGSLNPPRRGRPSGDADRLRKGAFHFTTACA